MWEAQLERLEHTQTVLVRVSHSVVVGLNSHSLVDIIAPTATTAKFYNCATCVL